MIPYLHNAHEAPIDVDVSSWRRLMAGYSCDRDEFSIRTKWVRPVSVSRIHSNNRHSSGAQWKMPILGGWKQIGWEAMRQTWTATKPIWAEVKLRWCKENPMQLYPYLICIIWKSWLSFSSRHRGNCYFFFLWRQRINLILGKEERGCGCIELPF